MSKGKQFFYSLGQIARSQGNRIEYSPYWRHRNDMPFWAYLSFCRGFDGVSNKYNPKEGG